MSNTHTALSRRRPDILTEELVAALSKKATFEFKQLFEIVHAKLLVRKAVSGGEDMLRLRIYEKLQDMVHGGSVKKVAKQYSGISSALAALALQLQSHRASLTLPLVSPSVVPAV
jgi:hypothetical protein